MSRACAALFASNPARAVPEARAFPGERRWWPHQPRLSWLLPERIGTLRFRRAPKLTDKDTIVLADFTNTTGDPGSMGRSVKVWWFSSGSLRSSVDFRRGSCSRRCG